MDGDFAELVEVIAHDASGRTKKFIKTKINYNEVLALRAQARLSAEEAKCAAMLKEADAVIQKAHDPQPTHAQLVEKARRPSALPAPAPQRSEPANDAHVRHSAPPQLQLPSPSPAVATVVVHQHVHMPAPTHRALPAVPSRRSHQQWVNETAEKARLRKASPSPQSSPNPFAGIPHRELHAIVRKEVVRQTEAIAARVGKQIGRDVMNNVLNKTPADAPPGATLTVDTKALEAAMQSAYRQLVEKQYCATVNSQVFAKAFAAAYGDGLLEAKHQFETTPRQYTSTEATA
jgi:hypothetical protein